MLTKQKIVQRNYSATIQSAIKRKILAVQMQWCSGYVPDCNIFPDNNPFQGYLAVSRRSARRSKPFVDNDDIHCPSNRCLFCWEAQLDLFHTFGSSTFCDIIGNEIIDENHANWWRQNKFLTRIVDDSGTFLSNLHTPLSRSWSRLLHIQPGVHNCQSYFFHQVEQRIKD